MDWWVYRKLFMAKNRHLVLLALKIPEPNSWPTDMKHAAGTVMSWIRVD